MAGDKKSVEAALTRRAARLMARVRASHQPIVWLKGIAGTGKSRLLQRLRAANVTLLDDPTPEALKAKLSGRRRLVLATRPDAAAAALLRKPRVYGDIDVIDDEELFVGARDVSSREVLRLTAGWPVLVDAYASGRDLRAELPDFLHAEVLGCIDPGTVATMFASLDAPLRVTGERSRFPLLSATPQGLGVAGVWIAEALQQLRPRLPRKTAERVLDLQARHGKPRATIATLLAMGESAQALQLFEQAGGPYFGFMNGFQDLESLLDGFGALEQSTDTLLFARLWCLIKQGRPREALLRLDAHHPGLPVDLRRLRLTHRPSALLLRLQLSEELDDSPPLDVVTSWSRLETLLPVADAIGRGMVYNNMAIAFLRSDHLLQARQLAQEALTAYERGNSAYLAHFMEVHLCDIALRQSRLRDAAAHLQRAGALLESSGLAYNTEPVVIDFFTARLAYEQGRFEDCPAQIEPTLQALLQGDSWPGLILAITAHVAFAAFWRHGLRTALEAVEQCVLTLGRRHGATPNRGLAVTRVRLYQIARRHAEAAALLEELELEPAPERSAFAEVEEALVRLRARIALGKSGEGMEGLQRYPNLEPRQRIALGILQATLHNRAGEQGLARRQLTRALRIAEAEGLLGALVEDGEFLERLLPVLKVGAGTENLVVLARRVVKLLRTLPSTALHSRTVAGVSRQEHRVLSYLTDGYTNKEIARALVLSESAVKFHLRNLFKKLEVRTRAALMQAARQRGIST